MNITTVVEGKRGCGYRKAGGLYLRTDGHGRYCGALPIELTVCPTCRQGIKPARGWTWINLAALVAVRGCSKTDGCGDCPIADAKIQDVGLIWIGEKFYPTPADFNRESETMGLSRRITTVPRGFVLGETWVALAHRKVISPDHLYDVTSDPEGKICDQCKQGEDAHLGKAGIFHVFKPSRIEYCVNVATDTDEKLEALEKRGITLVRVVNPEPIEQSMLPETATI
jgi:hypothetical protein